MEFTKVEKALLLGGLMSVYQVSGNRNKEMIEDYDPVVLLKAVSEMNNESTHETVKNLSNKLYKSIKEEV